MTELERMLTKLASVLSLPEKVFFKNSTKQLIIGLFKRKHATDYDFKVTINHEYLLKAYHVPAVLDAWDTSVNELASTTPLKKLF